VGDLLSCSVESKGNSYNLRAARFGIDASLIDKI
jgi:hypothetical protein